MPTKNGDAVQLDLAAFRRRDEEASGGLRAVDRFVARHDDAFPDAAPGTSAARDRRARPTWADLGIAAGAQSLVPSRI